MDRRPDKATLKLLKKHLKVLKAKFNPEKIILFGSRARGDNLKDSDIDILIVSDKFKGIPFRERIVEAYGMWDKKTDLEQICYTREEFDEMKKRIGIVKQAVKEGIEIQRLK